jgi:hypothetical protein
MGVKVGLSGQRVKTQNPHILKCVEQNNWTAEVTERYRKLPNMFRIVKSIGG